MGDSPRLRRIVLAYTVNQLGTWFGLVALSLAVLEHTHSDLAVAGVLAAPFVPALLAPAVVARVEASPRKGGLFLLYAIEAACTAGLAVLVWKGFWLPGIIALVALDGGVAYAARALLRSEAARTGQAASAASSEASEREAPPQAAAHRANAALNISLAVSGVAGPALAGVAVAGVGAPVALLIDASCFLATAALVLDLRPYIREADASIRGRLREARVHLRAVPRLRGLLMTQTVALVFFTSVFPVEVDYAKSTLGVGDQGYGALLAIWGIGMIVGSLLFARVGRKLWSLLIGGTLAVGLSYVTFAVAPDFGVAALAALVGGIGNGTQWASLIGLVQGLTPQRLLGRMMGVVEALNTAAPILSFALGGLLATVTSPRIAFFGAGCGALATAVAFLRSSTQPRRDLAQPRLELIPGGEPRRTDEISSA
jgi:hypothetical protein